MTERPVKEKRKSASDPEMLAAELAEIRAECASLTHWSDFVGTLAVPRDLYPTLVTGRPELIAVMQPRALSVEEAKQLYALIAGLIRTNQALRRHSERTGQLVANWASAFVQLESLGRKIVNFATFEPDHDAEEDQD